MVDVSDKGSSESEDTNMKTPERCCSSEGSQVRTCADCGTTKTPLWRGGPAGPKSLCNACGIRSRKKRRALLAGMSKQSTEEKKMMVQRRTSKSKLRESLKRKLIALGEEVVMKRSTMDKLINRRLLGEEERAAILLMSLSCGSLYAY